MKMLKATVILFAVMALATTVCCEDAARTGIVLDMEGSVNIRTSGGEIVPAEIGMELTQGDMVTTGADSFAMVRLDGIETATVDIEADSQMLISELVMDSNEGTQDTLLDLAVGKVLVRTESLRSERSKFEVKTPTSVVGVRGTTFAVEVEALE